MSTPELLSIQQALADNPYDKHAVIAANLGIMSNVVTMVCKEMSTKSAHRCQHGTRRKVEAAHKRKVEAAKKGHRRLAEKRKAELEANKPEKYPVRTVAVYVTDEEWQRFKYKYKDQGVTVAARLGDIIREDLKGG